MLDDDIDAAIKMMLSSFINAQKYSVKNTLRKTFQKYIIAMDDVNDLLMYVFFRATYKVGHYCWNL